MEHPDGRDMSLILARFTIRAVISMGKIWSNKGKRKTCCWDGGVWGFSHGLEGGL